MNIHQVMQYYQKTLDYFKPATIEYFLSQNYAFSDRKNIVRLFYAFIEICPFPDLFETMIKKQPPEEMVRTIIANNKKKWDRTVAYVCSSDGDE